MRKRFPVPAWKFREARLQCALNLEACADLLQVSERTVRNWESGSARIPYTAYKLMRLLRGGKVLGPEWRDYFIRGAELVTPEGRRFHVGDLAWWSLVVLQAQQWRNTVADQNNREPISVGVSLMRHPKAPRERSRRKAVAAGPLRVQRGAGRAGGVRIPSVPLDVAQEAPVASAVSIPRATRPAAGKDPLAGYVASNSGTVERAKSPSTDGQGPESKPLKSKGNSSEFSREILPLSLTQQNRPQESDLTHQPETAVSIAPAVHS